MSRRRFGLLYAFLLSLAVGASAAVMLLAEPAADRMPRLLLVTSGEPGQQACIRGAQEAARDRGVQLIVRTLSSTEPRRVTESIASALADGLDAAIVSADATGAVARQLKKLGVQTIVAAGDTADGEALLAQVATAGLSSGRIAAREVARVLPQGGRIIALVDDAQSGVGADRLAGMLGSVTFAGGAGAQWEVVERLEDHGNPADRAENLRSALESNADIDLVIDLGKRTGPVGFAPLCELAAAAGAKLITFDGSEEALAYVESGEVCAVVRENRYLQGAEAVNFLARITRENSMGLPLRGRGSINVPAEVVRRDNLARHRSQSFVSFTPAA